MPAKNSLKIYIPEGYYHIYNRGVEKRDIFLDERDCKVFLRYLKLYLSPTDELKEEAMEGVRVYRFLKQNLSSEIDLLAYALMPNHFHLLVKQRTADGIIKFMRRLTTSYVMYFNNKYSRVGSLLQNRFKAALILNDNYLLHCSRYIHLNPVHTKSSIPFIEFSSYPYYLGNRNASWIKPREILSYFKSQKGQLGGISNYKSFIEDYDEDPKAILQDLTLEDN